MDSPAFTERLRVVIDGYHKSARYLSDAVGISTGALSHYRNGRFTPNVETVYRLAVEVGVRPEWLAFGSGEMR